MDRAELEPGEGDGWHEFFAVCGWALQQPDHFVVPRGRARIDKAANAIALYLGGILGENLAGQPVEFAIQLQGFSDDYIPVNVGDPVGLRTLQLRVVHETVERGKAVPG